MQLIGRNQALLSAAEIQLFGLNQEHFSVREMQLFGLNQELLSAREMQLFALYQGAFLCCRNTEYSSKLRRFLSVTLHTAGLSNGRSSSYTHRTWWSILRLLIRR